MARPISNLIERAAAHCGKLVGLYSHFLVNPSYAQIIIEKPLSQTPVVWIGWHECNLLALAFHERILNRAAIAFVPPGLNGAAMRGWLEALHVTPIPIRRGMALRQVRVALAAGADVLIAVDGPRGPRHRIAPGALWLAGATGAEVRPIGCAASPAFTLPRWDRLVVPLPGARTAIAVGSAWSCRRDISGSIGSKRLATVLHNLTQTARMAVQITHKLKRQPTEATTWR